MKEIYEPVVANDLDHLKELVYFAIKKNGINADLNHIDTTKVTTMECLFKDSDFNGNISEWNVRNVKDMCEIFTNSCFTGDVSKWNVGKVETLSNAFLGVKRILPVHLWNVQEPVLSQVVDSKLSFSDYQNLSRKATLFNTANLVIPQSSTPLKSL